VKPTEILTAHVGLTVGSQLTLILHSEKEPRSHDDSTMNTSIGVIIMIITLKLYTKPPDMNQTNRYATQHT